MRWPILVAVAGLIVFSGVAFAILHNGAGASHSFGLSAGDRLIDVGGYRLYLHCVGAGRPTVVMDAGLAYDHHTWDAVLPRVAATTRACSYDRAGYGLSDVGPRPRTSGQIARELRTLLARAREPSPYLLVGHSFGGENMRLYAYTSPREVAGLVFVDSGLDDFGYPRLPPKLQRYSQALVRSEVRQCASFGSGTCGEVAATFESIAQVTAARHSLGHVPLVVLVAGLRQLDDSSVPRDVVAGFNRVYRPLPEELVHLSTNGQCIVARRSYHVIQHDQPDAVIGAIKRVVAAVRQHRLLSSPSSPARECTGYA